MHAEEKVLEAQGKRRCRKYSYRREEEVKHTRDKYMIGRALRAHGRDDVGLMRQTL